jgi:hypothetical protein
LDPFGVYKKLHELVVELEDQNFVKPGMRDLVLWATTVEETLAFIKGSHAK